MNVWRERLGPLRRRQVLQMIGATGTVLLAGCRPATSAPTLMAPAGVLPKPWADALPKPWSLTLAPAQQDWRPADQARADVLVIGDGWLDAHPADTLQPIASERLLSQLDGQAKALLASLGALQDRVLPLAVSPWVMLLRDDPAMTQEGWPLLLDSSMAGRVVLPASPRLVMSLADHLGGGQALPALRRQALTYDDRQATNWLLKGEAKVVVLPLSRCIALLGRDPRLRAILPASGAPLHWTVLLRPEVSREPVPQRWVEQGMAGSPPSPLGTAGMAGSDCIARADGGPERPIGASAASALSVRRHLVALLVAPTAVARRPERPARALA